MYALAVSTTTVSRCSPSLRVLRRLNRLLAAVAPLVAVASGCAGGADSRAPDVEVMLTSSDGQPVVGAVARILPQNPRHPARVADYLRGAPRAAAVQTDEQGRALLTLPVDRPFELVIYPGGGSAAAPGTPDSISFDSAAELVRSERAFTVGTGHRLRTRPVTIAPLP